jgi:uncharacterized membrane protein YjjP (DUF1212 family)
MLEIGSMNGYLIFFSGVVSGFLAHLKGDDRLRWFLMGFTGFFGPLITAIFSGRRNDERKGKDGK